MGFLEYFEDYNINRKNNPKMREKSKKFVIFDLFPVINRVIKRIDHCFSDIFHNSKDIPDPANSPLCRAEHEIDCSILCISSEPGLKPPNYPDSWDTGHFVMYNSFEENKGR